MHANVILAEEPAFPGKIIKTLLKHLQLVLVTFTMLAIQIDAIRHTILLFHINIDIIDAYF